MAVLDDIYHTWGGDLSLSATGDLAQVRGPARSEQRVVRRLLTNPYGYVTHVTYGAGLRKDVGSLITASKAESKIRGQMFKEASVARQPLPVVVVQKQPLGLIASINYTAMPDRQPIALSFSLKA